MTRDHTRKRKIRDRMTGNGEPFTLAARALDGDEASQGLRVLVMDDVSSDLRHLCQLLWKAPEVSDVVEAYHAVDVFQLIRKERFDAAFLDICVPGLDGLEQARVLTLLADPPIIVFVTESRDYALDALRLNSADYLLKPVHQDRLAVTLTRVLRRLGRV